MSEANAAPQVPTRAPVTSNAMRVQVKGRIESSRFYDGTRYTKIMTPAADQYSRPQIVEVRSKSTIGAKSDEVSVICVLGGFERKAYEAKDKGTGEVVKIVPVDHTLDLVE